MVESMLACVRELWSYVVVVVWKELRKFARSEIIYLAERAPAASRRRVSRKSQLVLPWSDATMSSKSVRAMRRCHQNQLERVQGQCYRLEIRKGDQLRQITLGHSS
jgi:hypothetical protein